ncbi:AEC family transporter [Wolbachia endosymbiont of Atemnus politus]
MILGFFFEYMRYTNTNFLTDVMINIRSTFITLGIVLLGVSIAQITNFKIDWKLALTTITAKYVFWPLFVLGIVLIDKHITGIHDESIYNALMLLAIIPVSGSSVILANILNYQPDRATLLLFISTAVGLFYVLLIISLFFAKLVPL